MASEAGRVLASGATQAEVEASLAGEDAITPITVEPEPEADPDPRRHRTTFQSPSLSRMRFDWNSDDRAVIQAMTTEIDKTILKVFGDAWQIMMEIFEIVREPELDLNGRPLTDGFGLVVWKTNSKGLFVEDFGKLTRAQRDHFLFAITTRVFAWEQRAADLWTDAMVAKGLYEEHFAISYDDFGGRTRGTVDDRRSYAQREAAEERYFAIFRTAMSRKADALVRTMTQLAQRLKDSLA